MSASEPCPICGGYFHVCISKKQAERELRAFDHLVKHAGRNRMARPFINLAIFTAALALIFLAAECRFGGFQ